MELLDLHNKYNICIKDSSEGVPVFKSDTNTILIANCDYWNQVYQLSHEFLHAAFNEHCKGKNISNYCWIEEILCEAFSIHCLKRFCKPEFPYWKLYLRPYMYYLNGNCSTREIVSSEGINTIQKLNEKLMNIKSYETRHFIHPLCLLIINIIDNNFSYLIDVLDFTKYLDKNGNFIECNNEIILLIKDFIEIKNLEKGTDKI